MAKRRRATTKYDKKPENLPDWNLKMKSKDSTKGYSSPLGGGWSKENGGISIKLNRGVVLSWRDCDDNYITLWPDD